MEKYFNTKTLGLFVFDGEKYLGELELREDKSSLFIYSNDFSLNESKLQHATYIQGTLNDSKKVTLIDVMLVNVEYNNNLVANDDYERSQKLTFDLRFLVFGNDFISDSESCFNSIEFSIPDTNTLFNYDSFSMIFNAKKESIKDIIEEENEKASRLWGLEKSFDSYNLGNNLDVYIYNSIETLEYFNIESGKVLLKSNVSSSIHPTSGFKVTNKVSFVFKPKEAVCFFESLERLYSIINLFELILGKKQYLCKYKLGIEDDNKEIKKYQVYQVKKKTNNKNVTVHPASRLIYVEDEANDFRNLLNEWISRQEEWKFARSEFFDAFTRKSYSSDLLIKAANLFDIVPDSAYEVPEKISDELLQAKEKCKDIFKSLPSSIDRDSILGALGRIGKKNLRSKIRDRYLVVEDSDLASLEEIDLVIGNAINCRNFFVHGSSGKFDYIENFNQIPFFIDTLLFIYGTSELIEMGWTFKNWKPDELNFHPFSSYLINYSSNLDSLKKVLSLAKES